MPPDAATEAQKNEETVFGKNPPRAADGKPLERGHGSPWAKMKAADRAHYLAVETAASIDGLVAQARALGEAATKFAESHKAVVTEVAKAKDEPVPGALTNDERKELEAVRAEKATAGKRQPADALT